MADQSTTHDVLPIPGRLKCRPWLRALFNSVSY